MKNRSLLAKFCSQRRTAEIRISPNCYLVSFFIIKSCDLSSDKIILWDCWHFCMTSKLGTQHSQEENLEELKEYS